MDPTAHARRIIIVSDATGETARQIIRAALIQFTERVAITLYKNVRNEDQVKAICDEAQVNHALVVHTIVSAQLRKYFNQTAMDHKIPVVDLLGPLLSGMSGYFQNEPSAQAGILHGISESYFKRIEAMEFTMHHDDGKNLEGLENADLVILGISRTSKTPLSMYFSHHGWKVANIPLIRDFQIPEKIYKIDQRRVVGLTIDPDELTKIRRARLQRLGSERGGEYADAEHVYDEVEYANELFRKNRRWAVFNVTGKALEETASEIIKLMTSRKLVPPHSVDSMTLNLSNPPK